jgi:ATP-binding cassette subfamily C (CFTR/MRP) protein 1
VEALSGSIEIDGIDISKVDLHTLRNKITVVPQDPVLFNGTLRYNLDPENKFTDEAIESLLNQAGLQELIDRESKAYAAKTETKR